MTNGSREHPKMTAGLDLGDKYTHLCLLDAQSGEIVEESRLCVPLLRPSDSVSTPCTSG
jgi:hypothetical protein